MRVVALIHFYLPRHRAGGEVMMHGLLRALVERKHEVHVVVTKQPEGEDEYSIDGIQVHRAGPGPRTVPALFKQLHPDLVVSHLDETGNAMRLARQAGVPFVQVAHNTMRDTKNYARMKPNLIAINTHWVERALTGWTKGVRTLVVHPPVDPALHRATPGTRVTLINLNRDKGSEIFYEVAQRMPDVAFLGVVGAHGDQIVRTDIKNVQIQPHTSDMSRDVWGRTKLLLMPSIYESYGMTAIEAAVSGIPTIANPTPGLLESLSYGGTFVSRDDIAGMCHAIGAALNQTTWNALSALALQRASELNPDRELIAWAETVEGLVS